ncbi:hypothetical protein HUW51_17195 [Adhaeribacter swui]|uniref:Ig-like domain-containing protein n=1 Tax=Adhaeribacter swui TaxID=2086471 RepID=A0A7G7GB40_9BACT|nr:hypothetical protein [Adhaeribacter swui]QNF34374.1 hypothetical protein HUW51_17195 [Adhaeribacter swui]
MKHLIAILCSLSLMLCLHLPGHSSPVKIEKEKLSYQVKPAVATTTMAEVNFLTVAFQPQVTAPASHLVICKSGQEQRLVIPDQRTRNVRSFTAFIPLRKLRNYLATIYKPHIRKRWQGVDPYYRYTNAKRYHSRLVC